MGRKFERISAGGVRDEAEIRGHRRTYIGAMPGTIIRALRDAGAANPLFMIDEIDKMGADYRGDPASAMLEVLDPEQNSTFRDHYLDVPFDLSGVLFITTANTLDTIPPPLRDRMEIIQLAGYTEEEKLQIAKRYLVPRQVERSGLKKSQVAFTDAGLKRDHRRVHAGGRRARAGARDRLGVPQGRADGRRGHARASKVSVTAPKVRELLGRARFQRRRQAPHAGAGRGHRAGVDAGRRRRAVRRGDRDARQGQVDDHRSARGRDEGVRPGRAVVRARARRRLPDDWFAHHDLHIHVPAGAIPKDGPSAGITMATALMSLVTGRPVRDDVAMTGELTLTGQVLPIGGLKEKALAAQRAGVRARAGAVSRNEPDVEDIPDALRKNLEFVWVERDRRRVRCRTRKRPTWVCSASRPSI